MLSRAHSKRSNPQFVRISRDWDPTWHTTLSQPHHPALLLTRSPIQITFQQPSPHSVLVRPHLHLRLLYPYLQRSCCKGRPSAHIPLRLIHPTSLLLPPRIRISHPLPTRC